MRHRWCITLKWSVAIKLLCALKKWYLLSLTFFRLDMPCLFSREAWVKTDQNNALRHCSLFFGKFLSVDMVRSQILKCCSVWRLSNHTFFLANMRNVTSLHYCETSDFRTNAKRQKLKLSAILCCDWLLRFAVRVEVNEKCSFCQGLSWKYVTVRDVAPLFCFRLIPSTARAAKLSFELSFTGKEIAMFHGIKSLLPRTQKFAFRPSCDPV